MHSKTYYIEIHQTNECNCRYQQWNSKKKLLQYFIENTASSIDLLFKRAEAIVHKNALCVKCMTDDYKNLMLF